MHRTWRERIGGHADDGPEPAFEPSDDPTLGAFAQLFLDSELFALDANKHLRTDALSPIYDCETESVREPGAPPDAFFAIWDPVWGDRDPVTGFRTGQDSAAFGSTPTVAMPQDERTAALLLLVTTPFVHLSAQHQDAALLVRGAVDAGDDGFRFVELVPSVVPVVRRADRVAARDELSGQ